ncbi:site-2 protease family protein [Tumidithrix elongata RA019]|uniref:Site-2 protease family protein n=1 Tax=Tumidithrix elongata BACA0141 TaxID=2716417 RepID=A0AAW9Q2G4_9CYAN|nr:site-2 protease family protein [Tumidithrix elongata RA019]
MKPTLFIPLAIFTLTLALLAWGYYRSRQFGKLGILSWLQLVFLMSPWVIYFGLILSGVFLSFAALLFLLVSSTVGYVILGNQVRKTALNGKSQTDRPSNKPENLAAISETQAPEILPPQVGMQTEKLKLQQASKFKPIPANDLKLIQGIFGIETFYATETIPYQEGVIFRGNLRGDAEEVHQRLSKSLSDRVGDRYNLFLVEGQEKRPVVIVLPHSLNLVDEGIPQKVLVGILVLANAYTALSLSGQIAGVDLSQHPEQFFTAIPFSVGIILILVCRELAMRWMAKRYQVKMSWPFLLPSSQLGSFGAFSRIQSPIPNRKALFDIAIAAPLASGLLSLLLLVVGLVLTARGLGGVEIPSQIFQASALVGSLAKLILGNALHVDLISIHPLVLLGWLGSVITALNLMPAGQLDGGRIVQAVYGRKTAGWTTALTLIFLAIATLINPLALYWAGIILILLRDLERPMLNEISDLDSDRDALGLVALFWMLFTLLPLTPAVAERLGIGS